MCEIDDTTAVGALVQGGADVTWFSLHLFGEANPLIDDSLLLTSGSLKHIDQRDDVAIFRDTRSSPPKQWCFNWAPHTWDLSQAHELMPIAAPGSAV